MHDLRNFTLKDMVECSAVMRLMGAHAASMEEVANGIVRYLYDHLIDKETGQKALVLVRFFKTHPYGELGENLRQFAEKTLETETTSAFPDMKCLTLLASAGARTEWNSRETSDGHKVIPLPSESFVDRFPMIRQLVQQLGLEVNTLLKPDPSVLVDISQRAYNVFYVPEAVGSPYVPAQDEFVVRFGVRSVLGFAGILPSGNLFAVIMFSRVPVCERVAEMFKTLALSAKLALLPFDGRIIFSRSAENQPVKT